MNSHGARGRVVERQIAPENLTPRRGGSRGGAAQLFEQQFFCYLLELIEL